nr:MAG TPA: zinc-ribbon domain protein [Bacteriophage sp.]
MLSFNARVVKVSFRFGGCRSFNCPHCSANILNVNNFLKDF